MIPRSFMVLAFFSVLIAGCGRPLFKPSNFAESFDPGNVIESAGTVLLGIETNTVPNRAFGMRGTITPHSYFRAFDFEPRGNVADPAALVARLKVSAESALHNEGFKTEYRQTLPDNFDISYQSADRFGTVHIFTTPTAQGSVRVIGVIEEYPK